MKAITTTVPFTVEGSESEVYDGVARCKVTAATRDVYTSYGWVQGDPPEVEVLDVVIQKVTVILHGVPGTWAVDDDEGLERRKLEVRQRLEGNEQFESDAVEAAADEHREFMCRGE